MKVDGNTHLSGGVVVANEKAKLEGLNSFETGTITSNDLVNKSEYDGEGFGISGGYGYQNDGPNNPKGTNPTQTETVNLPDGSHSVNKNVGYGKDKDSKSSVTQSGIGTGNIKVTDNEKQKELTGQTAEEAAKGMESNLTTETVADNSGALENIFDKEKVQAEIDLQVKVSQQFDRTRQEMKQIVNQKIDQYKDSDPEKAKDWQNAGLLLDMLAGGLSSPGDGFLGSLAGAANPAVAQMIKGMVNDGMLEEGGLSHILAHGIAGAAMAVANGGDLLSGALTAGGAEALAPIIAEFLYGKGKTPEDLTAEEKNTLSAIIGILGTGAGALTGDSAIDAVIGDSVATNAVENNYLQFVLGSGSSLVEGSFLIGGSSTLLDKEDLGEGLAGLLNSILNDLGYGDLDDYANEDGDIDLGALDSRALEEVKAQTREAYAYVFGKRDQIDNSYFTNNEFGQLLGQTLEIVGVDDRGNPVYSANSKGAGDWINRGDKVVLSDDGQTWDVYTEDGYFLSSLDINGTKSRYVTGLKKGRKLVFNPATSEDFGNTLVTIPPKVDNPQEGYIKPEVNIPNHTGDMSGSGKVDTGVIVGGGSQAVV